MINSKRHGVRTLLAMLGCLMISNVLVFSVQRADGASGFCSARIVHDYRLPFRKMRPIHHLPKSGQLPFAPRHTYLEPSSSSGILVSTPPYGTAFRYQFRSDPGADRTFGLYWIVRMVVYKVNVRGEPTKALYSRQLKLGRLDEATFNHQGIGVRLDPRPGLFRVDLVFETMSGGMILGKYQQYLRVVARKLRVGLGLNRKAVHSGETLTFRVENFGTEKISYGEEFVVERFNEGAWQVDPMTPAAWHRVRYMVGSGLAGKCQHLILPADSAGQYRIVKRLVTGGRRLFASFVVG